MIAAGGILSLDPGSNPPEREPIPSQAQGRRGGARLWREQSLWKIVPAILPPGQIQLISRGGAEGIRMGAWLSHRRYSALDLIWILAAYSAAVHGYIFSAVIAISIGWFVCQWIEAQL